MVRGVQEESLPSLISSITLYYMFNYAHCINFISNVCYIYIYIYIYVFFFFFFPFVILLSLILCSIEITLVLNHLCMTTADENAM